MKKNILILSLFCLYSFPCFSKTTIDGDFYQGGLIYGVSKDAKEIRFNGKKVSIDKNGYFTFGVSRDQEKQNFLAIKKKDNTGELKEITIKKRKWKIQKINGLSKRKVNPLEKDYKRILSEIELIKTQRAKTIDKALFLKKCFIQPVKGRISGVFGSQRILNGEKKSPHSGLDIAAVKGTKIKASADGIISLIHEDMFYTGKTVMIEHGMGIETIYVHMDSINVKKGQKVKQGDIIGTVGSTGRSTGPHLHWGLSWYNIKLDPQRVISNRCNIVQ